MKISQVVKVLVGAMPVKTLLHLQYRIDQEFDETGRSCFKVIRILSGSQVGRDFYNLESAEEYISEIVTKRLKQILSERNKNKELMQNQ